MLECRHAVCQSDRLYWAGSSPTTSSYWVFVPKPTPAGNWTIGHSCNEQTTQHSIVYAGVLPRCTDYHQQPVYQCKCMAVSALHVRAACKRRWIRTALHDTAMRASSSTHMIEHQWPGKIAPKTALPSIAASVLWSESSAQYREAAKDLLVEGPSVIVSPTTGRTVSL